MDNKERKGGNSRKLYWTAMPRYEVFFDEHGDLVSYIHENDATFRSEYQSRLFEHFGIEVEYFKLSNKAGLAIDKYMLDDTGLKYRPKGESLEAALIRIYVKPELDKVLSRGIRK